MLGLWIWLKINMFIRFYSYVNEHMKYYIYQINNQVKAIGSNSNDSKIDISSVISSIESLEFDDSTYPVLARTPKDYLGSRALTI